MAVSEDTDLASAVFHFDVCRYVSLAGLVILLYDHLLTLDDEIRYVWKTQWTVPKCLFLLNRYTVPTAMILHTWQLMGLANPPPTNTFCKVWLPLALYLGILSIANGGFIVLLRLWVLWNRRTRLVVWTLLFFIATQIASVAVVSWVVVQMLPTITYSPVVRSCILSERVSLQGLFLPGVIFEVMVFGTTCYNALDKPRERNRPLAQQLYKDGLVYFVVLTSLRLANFIISILAPLSLIFLGVFFVWCATNVTVSRLVLNIRREAYRHRLTEEDLAEAPGQEEEERPQNAVVVEQHTTGNYGYLVDVTEYYELRMHAPGLHPRGGGA